MTIPIREGSYKVDWHPEHVESFISLNEGNPINVVAGTESVVEIAEPDGYGYISCGLAGEGSSRVEGGVLVLSDGNIYAGDPAKWMVPISFAGDAVLIGPLKPNRYFLFPKLPKKVPEAGRYFEVAAGETADDWFVLD